MFFGEDFTINGIRIVQPTIGDILELGEKNFYNALSPFTNNSTSIRLMWTYNHLLIVLELSLRY